MAEELAGAVAARTGVRPPVRHGPSQAGERVIEVVVSPESFSGESSGEAFRLREQGGSFSITAGAPLGAARGAGHLARMLYGGEEGGIRGLDTVIEPAMRYRFVDLGGVGIRPDSSAWRGEDYSHHNHPLARVLLDAAPYVDPAAMAEVEEQFMAFVDRMAVFGYNGVVLKGFLEFVDFDYLGTGTEVYEAGSPYRARRAALRAAVGRMVAYARTMGVSVVLSTDMLALSEPLEAWLRGRLGGVDASDPRLWEAYRAALRELFEGMPGVEGLMIRIGEAGTVYNVEGWRYYSSLDVRSAEAVRLMLEALTAEAAEHGKTIYFRTWSVGVGEVGGMHTSPEMYERLLAGIDAPNLVVSTKFVMGDFYSHLPLNPTLMTGHHSRMVELQARREFEFFASFPNFLGGEHQRALQAYRASNPRIDGLWVWAQEGGPQRRSPISLYPFHGFWQLIDADVYVAAHLAWEPDADIGRLAEGWVRRTIGGDEGAVRALAEVLLLSREPVEKGLYVGPFARRQVRALGLEPPPMMWIFEWDIVTASSSVLSAIYFASRDRQGDAVAEGYEAVELARALQARVAAIDPASVKEPELLGRIAASLTYETDLLETLAAYRAAFLAYYRWLDDGGAAAYDEWLAARARFEAARAAHLAAYADDLDFRALSFFDADAGLSHARRAPLMAWLARGLLLLLLASLLAGTRVGGSRIPERYGRGGVRALWLALAAPGHAYGGGLSRTDRFVAVALPVVLIVGTQLVTTSFLAPSVTGLVLLVLLGLVVGRAVVGGGLTGSEWVALAGPLLLVAALPLVLTAVRGPGYFWFHAWTSDVFRTAVIVLTVVAWAWFFGAQYWSLRAGGRPRVRVAGQLLFMLGLPLVLLGGTVHAMGLEAALTAVNDELVVLPLGLSRILGIATHLNVPLSLPFDVLAAGVGAAVSGVALILLSRERDYARR